MESWRKKFIFEIFEIFNGFFQKNYWLSVHKYSVIRLIDEFVYPINWNIDFENSLNFNLQFLKN
jgi:hypothetical protein